MGRASRPQFNCNLLQVRVKQAAIDELIGRYLQGHLELEETARRLWNELRRYTPGLAIGWGHLPADQRSRGEALTAKLEEYMRQDMAERIEEARRAGKTIAHERRPDDPPPRTA